MPLPGAALPDKFWNRGLVAPFFLVFLGMMLSGQNLGLEFEGLVLYYLPTRVASHPHDAEPPNHLLVSL